MRRLVNLAVLALAWADDVCPAGSAPGACQADGALPSDPEPAAQETTRLEQLANDCAVEPLVAAVLNDDGVRFHLAHLAPRTGQSGIVRAGSPIMSAAFAKLPGRTRQAQGHDGTSGPLALIIVTFDGKAQWYRTIGSHKLPLESMGPVVLKPDASEKSAAKPASQWKQESVGSAAVRTDAGLTIASADLVRGEGDALTLALGHKSGNVSVWHFKQDQQQGPWWQQVAVIRLGHHGWESTTRIAASGDARMVLAASDDNAFFWRLSPLAVMRGGGEQAPTELLHVHAAESRASALALSMLSKGRYVAAIAFHNGAFEGWGAGFPDEDWEMVWQPGDPQERAALLWRLPRVNKARYVIVKIFSTGIIAASAEGEVSCWRLERRTGKLAAEKPLWQLQVGSAPTAISVLEPDAGSPWVVLAVGLQVVVLDSDTGTEAFRSPTRGDTVAFSWG